MTTNLLERDADLAELNSLFHEASAGNGHVVFMGGEAGIGKSALISAFLHQVTTPARRAVGYCEPLVTPGALGPILDVTPALGIDPGVMIDAAATRESIHRQVLASLASEPSPTVVVIEDAHWADEATINLVRYVGRRLGAARVLLLVSYRDDELGSDDLLRVLLGDLASLSWVSRMTLSRLSRAAVDGEAMAHGADPDELYRLTGGNPFYLTEMLGHEGPELPSGIRDAVLGRAARLPPEARSVLDAAAVAGVTVEVDLLREVVDEPVDDALERCFRLGLLDPHGDSVAFRHVIAWQTIRAHISSVRLTALDRRVLAALESDPRRSTDHARLALHAEEAGDHDAVVRHATAAAIEASRLAAHREAAAQYGRALRFAVGLPADVRADLLDRHSVECHLAGQVDRAIASRSVAVELWRDVGDRLRHGASLRWLAQLEWYAGRADEALAHGRLALDTLESIDAGPELAWAYALLAQLHMQSGADPATGLQLGTRAIALAEATGAHEARVHALCTVGAIEVNASDGAAIAHLEQSLALAKSAGYPEHAARALYNLASCMLWMGLSAAEEYVAEGLAICAEHDLEGWEESLIQQRAIIRLAHGDWDDALRDADFVLQRSSWEKARHETRWVRARIGILRGLDVASELDGILTEASHADALMGTWDIAWAHVLCAEAAWLRGDRDSLLRHAHAGFDIARDVADPWMSGELALWLRWAGEQPADVGNVLEPFRLQLSGDWRMAAAQWRSVGRPLEAARALMEGDEAAVRQAWSIFDELGARRDAQLAVARLRALGVRRIPRGARAATRSNRARLTAREMDVLRGLSEGWQDRRIADYLFLSPRTVGHHVSSVLLKLDAPNRTAAVEAARKLGILQSGEPATPD